MKWNNFRDIILILPDLCSMTMATGQDKTSNTLDELIRKVHGQSPANGITETRYLNARLSY